MKIVFGKILDELRHKNTADCRLLRGEFLLKLNVEGFPFSKHIGNGVKKYEEIKSVLPYFENIIILGIGGSALGTKMIYDAFPHLFNKKIYILDTTEPYEIDKLLNTVDIAKSLVISISKSGSTIETAGLTLLLIKRLKNEFGDLWKNRIFFITDPMSGDLREYSNENDFNSLSIPPELGGRYSVLSNVGLFPLYLSGFPVMELLEGAIEYLDDIKNDIVIDVFEFGHCNMYFYEKGYNILGLMPYVKRLKTFGEWFIQLWGESLGKINKKGEHIGQTPIVAVGPTDQHSIIQLFNEGPKDKVLIFFEELSDEININIEEKIDKKAFSYLHNKSFKEILDIELAGTLESLSDLGVPNILIQYDKLTPKEMGRTIMFSYLLTVFTAKLLEIDPFDQPGVEKGKKIMYKKLGKEGY
ncbi:glucose-6-phosphate isomerase [bacterium]|nr:glucose-6-phosphate isomerase [bacterium]